MPSSFAVVQPASCMGSPAPCSIKQTLTQVRVIEHSTVITIRVRCLVRNHRGHEDTLVHGDLRVAGCFPHRRHLPPHVHSLASSLALWFSPLGTLCRSYTPPRLHSPRFPVSRKRSIFHMCIRQHLRLWHNTVIRSRGPFAERATTRL